MTDNPMQPQWMRALDKANSMPRCGAKSRTRNYLPCKSVAMTNGRCRMHGGKNPGAPCGKEHGNYKHGLHSKAVINMLKYYNNILKEFRK